MIGKDQVSFFQVSFIAFFIGCGIDRFCMNPPRAGARNLSNDSPHGIGNIGLIPSRWLTSEPPAEPRGPNGQPLLAP